MSINERLIHTASDATSGSGNQEEGLILHLDANDVDSYDGTGTVWYDITNHEYTPAVDPAENFNTVTYTGNGNSNGQSITGVGFQPDLVWVKKRNASARHQIQDSVSGDGWFDSSDNIAYASSQAHVDNRPVETFDSDGFSIPTNYTYNNANNDTYVAWCFKAGGAAVSNTDGDVYSNVSVNNDLGFSIVEGTGSGTGVQTVGHGLDAPPEMVIIKNTNIADNWWVYHKELGVGKYLQLNTNAAPANWASDMVVNSTELGVRQNSTGSWGNLIAYCFTSKRGVSKVGSYTGGAAGNKIYTGFQPAFVMVKRTNGTGSWEMFDNARGITKKLYADKNFIEATNSSPSYIEFNADGFTFPITSTAANSSGNSYIYLAFAAEKPDSLIDDTDLELHLDPTSYSGSGNTWTADTGNNGTLVDDTSYDEELGDFFDLDGSGDYISLNTSGYLDGDFTVEMWWNFDNLMPTNDYQMLWGASGYGGSGSGLGHYINDNKIQTWIDVSGTTSNPVTSGAVLTQNKWHHIVLTRSGGTYTQFLDGSQVATGSGSSASLDSSTTRIGASSANSLYNVDGRVGQVRVYDKALSADEVMQNYRFTKNDYPNGKNATGNNMDSADWNSGGYFDFDGSSEYFTAPDLGINSSTLTMAAWVNLDIYGTRSIMMLGSQAGNAGKVILFRTQDSGKLAVYDGSSVYTTSNVVLTEDTWHHVALAVNGTSYEFFVDGITKGSITALEYSGDDTVDIGYYGYNSTQHWDGFIGSIKVYNKTLTSAEILADYNATKSTYI